MLPPLLVVNSNFITKIHELWKVMKVTKKICDIYIPIIWKFIYFKKGQKEKVDFW